MSEPYVSPMVWNVHRLYEGLIKYQKRASTPAELKPLVDVLLAAIDHPYTAEPDEPTL